ncbi:MAG: hypothetical protein V4590_02110 [Bacteroidota bacterium]
MNIDRNNYELFLMDYLDGKLDAIQVSEVLLFLEQHPDIKTEFEGVAAISISGLPEAPQLFTHLKQKEFEQIKTEYEPLLIDKLEGSLHKEGAATLARGMQLYPELIKEQELFAQTILQPDYSIVCKDKQSLKRGSIWIVHRNTVMRVAAVLLLTLTVGWYLLGTKIAINNHEQPTVSLSQKPQPSKTGVGENLQTKQSSSDIVKHIPNVLEVEGFTPNSIELNHTEFVPIQERRLLQVTAQQPMIEEELNDVSALLSYAQPQLANKTEDGFTNLRTLAAMGINSGAQQLGIKTYTLFEAVNRAAGVSLEKDSTSGKINRFKIRGLKFEWSKSK